MPADLIHLLTGPQLDIVHAQVVCQDPQALYATWEAHRVTCPACKAVPSAPPQVAPEATYIAWLHLPAQGDSHA